MKMVPEKFLEEGEAVERGILCKELIIIFIQVI
jgi:hypothetical protein